MRSLPDAAVEADVVDASVAHRGRAKRVSVDRHANGYPRRAELLADAERQRDDVSATAGLERCLELHERPEADSASFEIAVRMSIGIGNTTVELFAEPISSSVCR